MSQRNDVRLSDRNHKQEIQADHKEHEVVEEKTFRKGLRVSLTAESLVSRVAMAPPVLSRKCACGNALCVIRAHTPRNANSKIGGSWRCILRFPGNIQLLGLHHTQ